MTDPVDPFRERKSDRADTVENILDSVDPALEEHSFPVRTEQLAAQYGSSEIELPNGTELDPGERRDGTEDHEEETDSE